MDNKKDKIKLLTNTPTNDLKIYRKGKLLPRPGSGS